MRLVMGAVAVLLAASGAFAAEALFSVHESATLPSGVRYELEVREIAYVPPEPRVAEETGFWGTDGGIPKRVVQTFSLRLNGKPVYIPRKFYSDLSQVNTVNVGETKQGVRILVKGGDAAGGYSSELLVNKRRLVERMTRVGEFPNEVWERVILHNELLDHPERY